MAVVTINRPQRRNAADVRAPADLELDVAALRLAPRASAAAKLASPQIRTSQAPSSSGRWRKVPSTSTTASGGARRGSSSRGASAATSSTAQW